MQNCWHASAFPESVQTACSTCGFKLHHNNQAEYLSKLDYSYLTGYLHIYGQVMITTVNMLSIQKTSEPWEHSPISVALSSTSLDPWLWVPAIPSALRQPCGCCKMSAVALLSHSKLGTRPGSWGSLGLGSRQPALMHCWWEECVCADDTNAMQDYTKSAIFSWVF